MAVDDIIILRDASRSPSFFGGLIDAKAAFPFLFFILHMSWFTLGICVLSVVFFAVLSKMGYTLPVLFRKMRALLRGSVVSAVPQWLVARNLRRLNDE